MHVKVAKAPAAVTLVPHELVRSTCLFAVFPLDLDSALSSARPHGDTSIHAGDVWARTHSEYVLTGSRRLHAPHTWRADERERAARAHETSANVRSLHTAARTWNARAHAARRPARPPRGVISASPRGRARMEPDGRHGHARRHWHSFAPGNGDDITHLQDQVVVDSKIFNARLHVV